MNTEEQLAKIYGELEDMIDVQVYSHELRDDLIDASKAVRKARETAYRVLTKVQKDKYGMTISSSKKPIKSSVRDDFARGLQNIMKEKHAEFADGTLEDNMVDIYDNYVSQYYEEELKEEGGEAVAEDWFRNTYPDDEEGIFIHNSRKSIKSTFGGNAAFEIMDDKLMNARRNIRSCISINPRKELDNELQHIDELIGDALTHTEMVKNGDYDYYMFPVNNSHKPIKSSMETLELAYDAVNMVYKNLLNQPGQMYNKWFIKNGYCQDNAYIMAEHTDYSVRLFFTFQDTGFVYVDGYFTNGSSYDRKTITSWRFDNDEYPFEETTNHVKQVLDSFFDEGINVLRGEEVMNSRKPIKSSLEDRLIPYLEEFEEGYADTINRDAEEGVAGVYNDAFLEGFRNDYNLTNEDIEKLKEAVHNIWNESAEDEIRDMGEMYGVPRGATSEEALKHFE